MDFYSIWREHLWLWAFLGLFSVRNASEWWLTRGKGSREKEGKTGIVSLIIFSLSYFSIAAGVAWCLWRGDFSKPLFVVAMVCFLLLHGLRIYLVRHVLAESYSFYTKPLPGARLRKDGLYRWVRHPIYAVYAMEIIALSLIAPNWFSFFAWVVDVVATVLRIRNEERYLCEFYGDAYREYQKRTPMLVPSYSSLITHHS